MTQNTATAPAQHSLIKKMANQYGLEPGKFKDTLVKTVFPSDKQNVSNEQVAAFMIVADQYGLNPFIKEIYAFPGKGGGIIPIVSIDGWNTIINRQSTYDGAEFIAEKDDSGALVGVTCKIFRKDRAHPTVITEWMIECRRNTDPWKSHPGRMLRHKALIQCARYAFGLAGIYDEDEAERIVESGGDFVDVPAAPVAVISEAERVALVDLAKEQGVEKLGFIVESHGFEMLAHITADRYDDIVAAIKAAGAEEQPAAESADEPAIEAEPVNEPETAPEPEQEEEPAAVDAEFADLDNETETLREYCQEMFDSLDKNGQKNFLVGKVSIGKADKEQLEKYKDALETETAK